MATEPMAGGTTTNGAGGRTLLSVKNLKMHFPITQGIILQRQVGSVKAVDDISFDITAGRDARPGRRVRLRQVHDRPRDPPALQADGWRGRVQRPEPGDS